jgi:NitT/TauT family transport system substrate-binding protein
MKKLILILLILSLIISGCAQTSTEPAEPSPVEESEIATEPVDEPAVEPMAVSIAGLKGPTSMGMIQLIDQSLPTLDTYTVEYNSYGAPDELIGKIINGDVQIAAVPTNLASVLYNKTEGKIQLLAVNTLGVIHVVGSSPLESLEDLKGETLYVSGKGATPDYAVNYMLESLGLTDEVSIEFYPDHASLAQAVIAKDVTYAVLPQPFVTQVTMKSEEVDLLVDLNAVWDEASNSQSVLAMGCLVVNTAFADENPEFVDAFLTDYETSVNWVNENPADASVLIEKNGIIPNAALAEKAIPNCAIVYETPVDAQNEINNFLEILYTFNPSSVGGKLPDEAFYYGK